MRVTNEMLINSFLRDLQRATESLSRAREEIASGLKVKTPSDDPIKASRILSFRSTISKMKQASRNADYAASQLKAVDDVLNSITEMLLRAKDLTQETINAMPEAPERRAVAVEVNQLLETILQYANSTFTGAPIFAGTETDVAPFHESRIDGEIRLVQYQGNSELRFIDIGFGTRVDLNIPGSRVFFLGDRSVFEVLIDLRDSLRSGNIARLNELVDEMDKFYEHINVLRTEVGAKVERSYRVKERLEDAILSLSELLSQEEEVDMTEVLTRYRLQENVLMATMASGARILSLSLLNFLR
jgi:flagellar hook-associated protein 3 FlgL